MFSEACLLKNLPVILMFLCFKVTWTSVTNVKPKKLALNFIVRSPSEQTKLNPL